MLHTMFANPAISSIHEFFSQAQLELLRRRQSSNSSSRNASKEFRVLGWKWHHLGLIRHLSALQTEAKRQKHAMCMPSMDGSSLKKREQFLESTRFIVIDSWQLHNFVESKLFFPWISSRDKSDSMGRTFAIIKSERDRLSNESEVLTKSIENWVHCSPAKCESQLERILGTLRGLHQKANRLFDTSEDVVVPHVLRLFSEKEQKEFNSFVLKNLSGSEKRESLVVFNDGVSNNEQGLISEEDRRKFKNELPSAVRRILLPFWVKNMYGQKLRFLRDVSM